MPFAGTAAGPPAAAVPASPSASRLPVAMPATIRSALATGRVLAARPAKAARRRGKAAHTFAFTLTPTRLSDVPAGPYRLRFCRGVKVAVTPVVELARPDSAAVDASAGGVDWPAGGGSMTLLATLYRDERSCEDPDEDRGDDADDGDGGGVEREAGLPFDVKDAKITLLRVSLESHTEATLGKAHFDLSACATIPAGTTPLSLHLSGGAVVELLVGTSYVARGSSRRAGSDASSCLNSLSLGSTAPSLSSRAPSDDAASRTSSVSTTERHLFGGGGGRGEGGARRRARRAEAEAARLRLEVAAMKAELAAMRVGRVSLDRRGGDGGGGGGGAVTSSSRHSCVDKGGSGGGSLAGTSPLPCGVTAERLLAELLDTKGALVAAVDARLTLEWAVGQARRDDARVGAPLAEALARHASRLEVQLAGAMTELHTLRRGEGGAAAAPVAGATPARGRGGGVDTSRVRRYDSEDSSDDSP